MIVKRFGCTTIHNKALYKKCFIHSFLTGRRRQHGALASTPLVYFEWSDVKRCRTELWVRRVASLALLAAEVENF